MSCWPWTHRWTKWKEIARGDLFAERLSTGSQIPIGYFVEQQRECERCGKMQIREIST